MPGCILQAILVQKWVPMGRMNLALKNTQAHARKPCANRVAVPRRPAL